MELITTKEVSIKWGISSRRITTLCNEGRIDGAVQKGHTWLIPDNIEKPRELKRGRKNGQ